MDDACYRSIPNILPAFLLITRKGLEIKMYRSVIELPVLFSRAMGVHCTEGIHRRSAGKSTGT
jgi:hypothetical protein